MRKGIKFSMGVALAAVAGFVTCPTVQAAELGDTVTTVEPAVALIMPFDVTDGKASSSAALAATIRIRSRPTGRSGRRAAITSPTCSSA
jgi:hypothetical protein